MLPIVLKDKVPIVEELIVQECMGHEYLGVLNMKAWCIITNIHLADRDQDVQQLADEKAKSIFVKLIVDMFVIMLQK